MDAKLSTSRWERLKWFLHFAVGIALALTPLVFSTDRFRLAFSAESLESLPLPQLSIVLLIMTIFLILGWFRAVSGELEMLRVYAEEFLPTYGKNAFYVGIALGIALSLLVFFSYRPLVYSGLFVCYKLFEIWAIWIRDPKIAEGFKNAREQSAPDDVRRRAWDIIEKHYFHKPQIPLAVTELCLVVVALVLSVYGEVLPASFLTKWLSSAAYIFIILTLVLNSVVYTRWRRERDRALGEFYS